MAIKLTGYRRGGRFNRGYVAPSGAEISYREYRKRLETAGKVTRLDALALAEQRRRQRTFNDIISQMAKVRSRTLVQQIETAQARGQTKKAETLQTELRHVKSSAIKSDIRKNALRDLYTFGRFKGKDRTPESEERTKLALIALGRREGIPDWVDVGDSDAFKAGRIKRGSYVNWQGQRTRRK